MSEDDRAYMQQIFDETYSHAFEDPVALALALVQIGWSKRLQSRAERI